MALGEREVRASSIARQLAIEEQIVAGARRLCMLPGTKKEKHERQEQYVGGERERKEKEREKERRRGREDEG